MLSGFSPGEGGFVRVKDFAGETGENDAVNLRILFQGIDRFSHCDPCGLWNRIAVDAATDRRKSNRVHVVLARQIECVPITRREQVCLPCPAAAPNRANGMNDMFRREPITASDPGLAGLAAANFFAFCQEFRAGRAMDRSIDSAATEQRGIRGIHDRIDLQPGDVLA